MPAKYLQKLGTCYQLQWLRLPTMYIWSWPSHAGFPVRCPTLTRWHNNTFHKRKGSFGRWVADDFILKKNWRFNPCFLILTSQSTNRPYTNFNCRKAGNGKEERNGRFLQHRIPRGSDTWGSLTVVNQVEIKFILPSLLILAPPYKPYSHGAQIIYQYICHGSFT